MSAAYTPTRLMKRRSSRFQSNHQRGYFSRKRINSSGGMNSSPMPPITIVALLGSLSQPPVEKPSMLAITIAIGMIVKMRNAVVRRSRARSG